MNDFLPAIIALGFIAAAFVYGYLTDPYRHRTTVTQPEHGEATMQSSLAASKVPYLG